VCRGLFFAREWGRGSADLGLLEDNVELLLVQKAGVVLVQLVEDVHGPTAAPHRDPRSKEGGKKAQLGN